MKGNFLLGGYIFLFFRYMDSYQDNDLVTLRDKWLDVLSKRKEYLDQEIKRLAHAGKLLEFFYIQSSLRIPVVSGAKIKLKNQK